MSKLTPSQQETARMELILTSPVLGIAYQDGQRQIQEFDDDPAFRELIEEYLRQRVHQAIRAEMNPTKQYTLLDD